MEANPLVLGYPNALPVRIFYRRTGWAAAALVGRSATGIGAAAWAMLTRGEFSVGDVIGMSVLRAAGGILTGVGVMFLAAAVWTLDRDGRSRVAARWSVLLGWAVAWGIFAESLVNGFGAVRSGVLPPLLELLGMGVVTVALETGEIVLLAAAMVYLRHLAVLAPRADIFPEMLYWFVPGAVLALGLRLMCLMLTASLLVPRVRLDPTVVAGWYLLVGPWLMIGEGIFLGVLWLRLWTALRGLRRKMYAVRVG